MKRHPLLIILLAALAMALGGYIDIHGIVQPTLTPLTVAMALAIVFLFAILPVHAPGERTRSMAPVILLALAVLKTVAMIGYQPPGLLASYYSNPDFVPPHETSWRYRGLASQATRIDPGLDFSPNGFSLTDPGFPLHFVNDWNRFNWRETPEDDHRRKHFRFSAIWSGTLSIPESITHLQLASTGGMATVRIGSSVLQADHGTDQAASINGGETVTVAGEYRRSSDEAPSLRLTWSRDGETFTRIPPRAYAAARGFTGSNRPWELLHHGSWIAWFAVLAVLAWQLVDWRNLRKSRWGRLGLLLLFVLMATAALLRQVDKGTDPTAQIFTAGNDWLRYETQASDILKGDWLNRAYTEGQPFFMNVAYRYWMAGMHLLAGEDVLMLVWLQQMLMSAFVLVFYALSRRWLGRPAAITATVLMLASGELLKYPAMLLDTTFSVMLSAGLLATLMRWRHTHNSALLLGAAALLALSIATRANFLPFVMVAALWVMYPHKDSRWQWSRGALMVIAGLLPLLFTGIRNAVVTGEWMMMPSSGSFNLWIGNHPPVGEHFHPFDFPPIPPMEDQGRIAIDYILAEPGAFFYRIAYKLAYLFGIVIWKSEIAWGILVPTTLALLGFMAAALKNTHWRAERLLLGLWVSMNFASLCLVFPWVYGWRLSGPTLPAIGILGALAISDLWQRYQQARKRP